MRRRQCSVQVPGLRRGSSASPAAAKMRLAGTQCPTARNATSDDHGRARGSDRAREHNTGEAARAMLGCRVGDSLPDGCRALNRREPPPP